MTYDSRHLALCLDPIFGYNHAMRNVSSPVNLLTGILVSMLASVPLPAMCQDVWQPPRLLYWYSDNLNPNTGGDILLTAHYAVGRLEDNFLLPSPWSEADWLGKSGAVAYRILKFGFIDYNLLAFFTAIPQHEIFGHGYRVREFGFGDPEYSFSPPAPYGDGVGITKFSYPRQGPTDDQELAVTIGGVEASAVMAGKMRGYWLQVGNMDYHGALLYAVAAEDLSNYLSQTHENKIETDRNLSNDMLKYIKVLNGKEDRNQIQSFRLHLSQLAKESRIAFLDPFLWYAYWTVIKTHLWSGKSVFNFPAIPLGPVRYLPLCGYGLTPWGPEFQVDNMVAWEKSVLTWRVRIGEATFRKSWGMDLEGLNVLSWLGYDLDLGGHIWKQPRLRLDVLDQNIRRSMYGGGGSANILSPTLDLPIPIRLAGGIDYKSSGFLPGANLEGGLSWRIGMGMGL